MIRLASSCTLRNSRAHEAVKESLVQTPASQFRRGCLRPCCSLPLSWQKNIYLCWRRPCHTRKAIRNFFNQVEDHCNVQFDNIHASRLKLFRDNEIDETAIMSHAFQSESGTVVPRILSLEDCPGGLYVCIRWRAWPMTKTSLR